MSHKSLREISLKYAYSIERNEEGPRIVPERDGIGRNPMEQVPTAHTAAKLCTSSERPAKGFRTAKGDQLG